MYIFWDNDGVLVNTEGLFFEATREVLATIDIPLTREFFISKSLHKGGSVFDLAAERGHSRGDIEALRDRRDEVYARTLQAGDCTLEGVSEVLEELSGQIKMAVVTSSKRRHFELAHAKNGLLQHFDFILTREDYVKTKPFPEPYLTALKRSGRASAECIVIEDTQRGLESATAAGIKCMVIPTDLSKSGNFTKAVKILSHIREVPAAAKDFFGWP